MLHDVFSVALGRGCVRWASPGSSRRSDGYVAAMDALTRAEA